MSIVGLLKFSNFTNNHFEQLKNGKVFFNSPSFFANNGSVAQKDFEGTSRLLSGLPRQTIEKYTYNIDTYGNIQLSIDLPLGLKFGVLNFRRKSFLSLPLYNEYEWDSIIKDNSVTTVISKLVKKLENDKDIDVIIYPQSYEKVIVPYSLIMSKTPNNYSKDIYYKFKNPRIKFCNSEKNSSWRISCFTAITTSDIDNNTLKPEFIHDLLNGTVKGSIAIDQNNHERPWVFIPYSILKKELTKFKYIKYGNIRYYRDRYPFNIGQIISNPNNLLFAKSDDFKNQHEFRLILGGPNNLFTCPFNNPLVDFHWKPSNISYGKTIKELKSLKIINE